MRKITRICAIGVSLVLTACSIPTQSVFTPIGGRSDEIDIGKQADARVAGIRKRATPYLEIKADATVLTAEQCNNAVVMDARGTRQQVSSLRKRATDAIGAMGQDAVVNEVVNAAVRTAALTKFNTDISACADVASKSLTYQNFADFAGTVSGFSDASFGTGIQAAEYFRSDAPALSAYLLVYLNNYFQGKFVDRFETQLAQPSFSSGVSDTVISNFARIILEAVFDCALNAAGGGAVYVDNIKTPTTYYPAGTKNAPTATLAYQSTTFVPLEAIVPLHQKGVTIGESQFTEFAANQASAEAVILSSGFLKTLANIHAGIIISGTFAVGDNNTVVDVVTAAIEVLTRRSVEAASYEVFEQIDGDKLPLVTLISVLGSLPPLHQ